MRIEEKIPILYVDDEQSNLIAFKANFRRYYEIFIASSAEEGLEILRKEEVAVVLSDQRMPNVTGIEFFESIHKEFPDIIRILVTGYADINAVIEAINRGKVYGYVSKPWKEEELRDRIDSAYQETFGFLYEEEGSSSKHHEELEHLLQEYNTLWEAWINRSSLLSAKEVLAIEYYRKHKNHKVLAGEIKTSVGSVYQSYSKAIRKLRGAVQKYNSWIMARALELNKGDHEGDDKEKFLKTPFVELELSSSTLRGLRAMDFHKPEDLIHNTTIKKMSKFRNFGQKKMEELLSLFEKNGCLSMLKEG